MVGSVDTFRRAPFHTTPSDRAQVIDFRKRMPVLILVISVIVVNTKERTFLRKHLEIYSNTKCPHLQRKRFS